MGCMCNIASRLSYCQVEFNSTIYQYKVFCPYWYGWEKQHQLGVREKNPEGEKNAEYGT